jgi:flagellin
MIDQSDLPPRRTDLNPGACENAECRREFGDQKEPHTMPLTVLNNISSLTAENALSNTQMNLQKTLTQLSTGLKINSGSDDSAGLSIANGMQANIAALTQSQQNANNGVGLLQTADGALSQVTTLLNRAVTLATEGSNTSITSTQATALNTEFQSILSEVNQIGQATNFNGQNVFAGNTGTSFDTTSGTTLNKLNLSSTLAIGSVTTVTDNSTGKTATFTATAASDAITDLNAYLKQGTTAGGLGAATTAQFTTSSTVSQGSAASLGQDTNNIGFTAAGGSGFTITTSDTSALASLGAYSATAATVNAATDLSSVYISDSSTVNSAANTQINTSVNALSASVLGLTNAATGANDTLTTTGNSQSALTAINAAITAIAAQRGVIGASVNRLNAATNVMADQVQNLTSASNSIQNADIGKTVANMTQYNILQSTGMAALQQSNQAQQAVLKLVQ